MEIAGPRMHMANVDGLPLLRLTHPTFAGAPKGSPAYDEELFGPVASLFKVRDIDEAEYQARYQALKLANDARLRYVLVFKNFGPAAGANPARSVIMIQMLTQVFYIALVIARLLGLTLVKFRR